MLDFFKRRRRDRLRAEPFPAAWDAILEQNLPPYRRLNETDRAALQGRVQVMLGEIPFEGCGGLEMNDEIRVTIAGGASLLLLRRPESEGFGRLVTVLVYPGAYVAPSRESIGGGMVIAGEQARLGEASQDGVVVLSWDDVQAGASDFGDGQNVVLHEFAHQLDQADGAADGTPPLGRRSKYIAWARVLGEEYDRLRAGRPSALDAYGSINPAEFFAVATECFFERPEAMQGLHPELFNELREYFGLDPRADL